MMAYNHKRMECEKKKTGDKTTTGSQNMEAHSNQPATGHHRTLPSMDLCTSNHDGDN